VAAARAAPLGLLDLWAKLNDAIGLPRKRLRAHVTLARKVTQAPVPQAMSPIEWQATDFSLIRSDTGGIESAYTVLDTWSLLDETENH
jgi:2'-5' RNA ligase